MSPYSKRLLSKSKQIIEKFIDPVDGVQIQPINIDGNTTNTIKSNIIDEKVTLELFNQAVKEIETIVNTSIIPKFLNSDIFRDKVDPLIKLSITYYRGMFLQYEYLISLITNWRQNFLAIQSPEVFSTRIIGSYYDIIQTIATDY